MEEFKVEIDLLVKCRNNLEDFKKNAIDCDNVTLKEYELISDLAEKLNDRLINKQIEMEAMEENG